MNIGQKVLQAPGAPKLGNTPHDAVGIVIADGHILTQDDGDAYVLVEWPDTMPPQPQTWLVKEFVVPVPNSILDVMVLE